MTSYFRKIIKLFVRFKDLATIGASQLIASAIGGVFWIVLTTLMDAEAYGEIGYHLSIAAVIGVAASLGTFNTITVYTAKGEKLHKSLLYLVSTSGIISSINFFDTSKFRSKHICFRICNF